MGVNLGRADSPIERPKLKVNGWLSYPEAAKHMGLGLGSVRVYASRGWLERRYVAGIFPMVSERSIAEYMEKHKRQLAEERAKLKGTVKTTRSKEHTDGGQNHASGRHNSSTKKRVSANRKSLRVARRARK